VVYDSGQNSAQNQQLIEATGLHFVGSVPPSDHPDLLAVPRRRYKSIDQDQFPGLTGFESSAEVLGKTRRVIVTHSENFHQKQLEFPHKTGHFY
jgi:transposase